MPTASKPAVEEQLRAAHIEDAAELAALAIPAFRLRRTSCASDALPLGASRFGGDPDVPAGFVWPHYKGKAQSFLAQLDLSEVASAALPRRGWLLFFCEIVQGPWGYDPDHAGAAKVVYLDVPRQELRRMAHPPCDEEAGEVVGDCVVGPFAMCAVRFEETIDLPDRVSLDATEVELDDDQAAAYDEITLQLSGRQDFGDCYHHLLGYPQPHQLADMREMCQLASNGFHDARSKEARAVRLAAPTTWQLLLQLDSDDEPGGPGWTWADVGSIYYWIRREDLAAQRFDATWLVLQCG